MAQGKLSRYLDGLPKLRELCARQRHVQAQHHLQACAQSSGHDKRLQSDASIGQYLAELQPFHPQKKQLADADDATQGVTPLNRIENRTENTRQVLIAGNV